MPSILAQIAVSIAGLAAVVAAQPGRKAPAGHEWKAPGPNDVRSPCPGLNTLANHGFIPRSGKGMTVQKLIKGITDGVNVGIDFDTAGGLVGLQATPDPLTATSFNLDQLDEHNFPLEHDGSLSRDDYYFGNDHSFNQTIWNSVADYFKGAEYATIASASLARINRINAARAVNPDFIYGPRQLTLSYGETALYLSAMGSDPLAQQAPVAYIQSFFEKEELPYALGWKKSKVPITFASLGALIVELAAANPDVIPEGLTLGEGALRDVWQLKNPITGKAENATCILAGTC